MAYLGVPYRVVYESQNGVTGLTGMVAVVMKPDMTTIGPFQLSELNRSSFPGLYYFDLNSDETDPEGEWIGMIYSPSENWKREPFRVSIYRRPSLTLQGANLASVMVEAQETDLQVFGDKSDLEIFSERADLVVESIESNEVADG